MQRLVAAALSIGQTPSIKRVYIAYCNNEAAVTTQIAGQLEHAGISAWVVTKDCIIGANWRQAQASGTANAAARYRHG